MKPILYWYPIVYHNEDDPEDKIVERRNGKIIPFQLDREPYDIRVDASGCSFHLIFGTQVNGMFLCIPNWDTGCEIASLTDRSWNMDSLLHTDRLDYEDATAIVWALYHTGNFLKLINK